MKTGIDHGRSGAGCLVGCHSPLTNCRHHKHSHWHRRYTTISIRNAEAPQMPHRMHPPHNHYCGLCSKLSKTPKEPAKDCTGPPYLNTFTISSQTTTLQMIKTSHTKMMTSSKYAMSLITTTAIGKHRLQHALPLKPHQSMAQQGCKEIC